jgi:hypothetical protein
MSIFTDYLDSLSPSDRRLVERVLQIIPEYMAEADIDDPDDDVIGFGEPEPR